MRRSYLLGNPNIVVGVISDAPVNLEPPEQQGRVPAALQRGSALGAQGPGDRPTQQAAGQGERGHCGHTGSTCPRILKR